MNKFKSLVTVSMTFLLFSCSNASNINSVSNPEIYNSLTVSTKEDGFNKASKADFQKAFPAVKKGMKWLYGNNGFYTYADKANYIDTYSAEEKTYEVAQIKGDIVEVQVKTVKGNSSNKTLSFKKSNFWLEFTNYLYGQLAITGLTSTNKETKNFDVSEMSLWCDSTQCGQNKLFETSVGKFMVSHFNKDFKNLKSSSNVPGTYKKADLSINIWASPEVGIAGMEATVIRENSKQKQFARLSLVKPSNNTINFPRGN